MRFFTTDIPCPSCGYNLRGLSLERGCPECGLRITSTHLPQDDANIADRIDIEVEENLRQMSEATSRDANIAELIAAWKQRGERFDRLLGRIEKLVDRYEKKDDEGTV